MRITCPNCQAQYDVDPAMIPEAGRDVQCSSCAHTWLQGPEAAPEPAEAAEAPEPVDESPVEEADADETEAAGAAEEGAAEEPDAETTADDAASDVTSDEEETEEAGDAGDKFRAAMDRQKSDEPEPEPEPEDFLSDMRDAVADPDAEAATDEVEAASGDEAAEEETPAETEEAEAPDDTEAPEAEEEPVEAAAEDHVDEEAEDKAEAPAAEAAEAAPEDDAPALDEEVAEILREEAEREVTQRRSEDAPPALEPQGDLGLSEGPPSELLRERLDRMRGEGVPQSTVAETLAAATATPLEGPRRERLPDIEEIKTTLRPGDVAEDDEPPIGPAEMARIRQSGFRRGFTTLVLAAGILVAGYVFAPQIIDLIPTSEVFIMSYVEVANDVRDGIDRVMARAITGLNGVIGDT